MEACIGNGKTCTMIRMDIHQALELFSHHHITVDMIYIDAEKKAAPLVRLLNAIREKQPR